MRKKSGFTIVEQAIVLVPEFENVVRKLEQQVVLRGQSFFVDSRSIFFHRALSKSGTLEFTTLPQSITWSCNLCLKTSLI